MKPESITLNEFINKHKEEFVPFELWIVDELTDFIVKKQDLDKEFTSIVVDCDEDEPLAGLSNSAIQIRLNGRLYFPLEDRTGRTLNLSPEQWTELAQEWFDQNEVTVSFDHNSKDLLKFTAILPAIEIPPIETPETQTETAEDSSEESGAESAPISPEGDETPDHDTEPAEDTNSPETEISSPDESTPESTPSEDQSETDEELAEFEKALGL